MTPHNAFVRINTNRQLFGMPLLTEAPSYLQDIPEPSLSDKGQLIRVMYSQHTFFN